MDLVYTQLLLGIIPLNGSNLKNIGPQPSPWPPLCCYCRGLWWMFEVSRIHYWFCMIMARQRLALRSAFSLINPVALSIQGCILHKPYDTHVICWMWNGRPTMLIETSSFIVSTPRGESNSNWANDGGLRQQREDASFLIISDHSSPSLLIKHNK